PDRLELRGLDPGLIYRVTPWPDRPDAHEVRRGGDLLMAVGVGLEPEDPSTGAPRGDFEARLYVLSAD
ncbi:MAG: GH36 C-terminal domain-containing protein, partial [Chloroflexota bacterium]